MNLNEAAIFLVSQKQLDRTKIEELLGKYLKKQQHLPLKLASIEYSMADQRSGRRDGSRVNQRQKSSVLSNHKGKKQSAIKE